MTASLETANHPHAAARSALHGVTILVAVYLALSALTLAAIVVFRGDPAIVNVAAWIRGSFALANAALLFVFARRASDGAPRALLRVRLISAIVLVAVVVIVALPATFPLWMRIEQGACGLVLLAVVLLVNGRRVRSSLASN
ncbi:MAG TPA: hypothetical protein VGF80_08615 [Galbitalea sp.]|jgi:hypothetical protein